MDMPTIGCVDIDAALRCIGAAAMSPRDGLSFLTNVCFWPFASFRETQQSGRFRSEADIQRAAIIENQIYEYAL
jgi:hypothetical protein